MKPQSFKVQKIKSCVNCMACFTLKEYDSPDTYYCMWWAKPRPRCGSVLMDEGFGGMGRYDRDKMNEGMKAWDEWSMNREVNFLGICNMWRKRDEA